MLLPPRSQIVDIVLASEVVPLERGLLGNYLMSQLINVIDFVEEDLHEGRVGLPMILVEFEIVQDDGHGLEDFESEPEVAERK